MSSYFHGVYLLSNLRDSNKCYIGYTVNPSRRINQHNKGALFGGAKKTSNRGPWKMILIVHGFPNDVSGLRFEWAWQHPRASRRLRSLQIKKSTKETALEYQLKIMWTMLRTPPWNRLPLTVQWLGDDSYEPPPGLAPPPHVSMCYGPIGEMKVAKEKSDESVPCFICQNIVMESKKLTCASQSCGKCYHVICLADEFLKGQDNILPLMGNCPNCGIDLLWGDLVLESLSK